MPRWLARTTRFGRSRTGWVFLDVSGKVTAILTPGGRIPRGAYRNIIARELDAPKLDQAQQQALDVEPAALPANTTATTGAALSGRWEADITPGSACGRPYLEFRGDGSWVGSGGEYGRWVSGLRGLLLATTGPVAAVHCSFGAGTRATPTCTGAVRPV